MYLLFELKMIQINVLLASGRAELLTLLSSSTVQEIRTKTQQAFGNTYFELLTAKNRILVDFKQTLEESEIEDGDCLTAVMLQPQLAATRNSAFALLCHGHSVVVTWGQSECGGNSLAVQDQLRGCH